MKKLTLGKGNLLRRSEEFIELGVKAKKEDRLSKTFG